MIKTAILGCLALLTLSCNVGCVGRRIAVQAQVDAMRAEQLELEDRYYRLESDYKKAQRELKRLQGLDDGDADPNDAYSDGDEFGMIDDGGSRQVSGAAPANSLRGGSDDAAYLESSREEPPLPNDETPWIEPTRRVEPKPLRDWRVTHLVINPLLSKGRNFDGRYGDDGISLVVEPRNADDQYVPLPGPLTVSLIDPNEEGELQRVGLWQLTEEEVDPRVYGPGEEGQGIQLKLPWQHDAPRHRRLMVFVRYETPEGELLEASNEVSVLLAQSGLTNWSPRETPLMTVSHEEPIPFERSTTRNGTATDASGAGPRIPASRVARPRWSPYR